MDGWNGTERDRATGAEEKGEEEMEGGGDGEVKGYGREEEGPSGTP